MKKLIYCLLPVIGLAGSTLAEEKSVFGDDSTITGFTGYLYDLKFYVDGDPTDVAKNGGVKMDKFYDSFKSLIRSSFSDRVMEKLKCADEACDLHFLSVPSTDAKDAPAAFGSPYIDPSGILIVYKGIIESAPSKKFRFAGVFDDAMVVLVNGKVVFYVSRHEDRLRYKPDEVSNRRKEGGVNYIAYGDYIELKKGDELVLALAEIPGGSISGVLQVQLEGFNYKEDSHDDPILHPFIAEKMDRKLEKVIERSRMKYEFSRVPEFIFKKD